MIFQNRWQAYYWPILLAFALVLIGAATRVVWFPAAGFVILLLLLGRDIILSFAHDRRTLALIGVYTLGALVNFTIGAALITTGRPAGVAAGWTLIGVYALPAVLCFLAALTWLGVATVTQVRAFVGERRDYYRGTLDLARGRYERSRSALDGYVQRFPNDVKGRVAKAGALTVTHRYEEALTEVERALELDRLPEGLMLRGQILSLLGVYEEGLADVEAALALKAGLPWRGLMLANALIGLRRLDDALKALEREGRRFRGSAYHMARGEVYRLLRRNDAAVKAYRRSEARARAEIAAGIHAAEATLAYVLAQRVKLADAEKAAASALARNDSDSLGLYAQALVCRMRDDYDGVEAALERMMRVTPGGVVNALSDPDFTALLSEQRFRRLLGRALQERDRILQRVRSRARPDL